MSQDFEATLAELAAFIRSEHPTLHERFRPGLSDREIDQLAQALRPYHLPAELVALYGWHDGWELVRDGERVDLLPDADFSPLKEAIDGYHSWLGMFGTEGWHPLWFPAFGTQSGELVALQSEPGRSAGQLYSFHPELDLESSYDSVGTLFSATLECWRTGLLPPPDIAFLTPELRGVVARHNPGSRTPDGRPRRLISRFATADWPAVWREVAGIAPSAACSDERAVTIADFLANPSGGRPIRAELQVWGGSMDAAIVIARDETGELRVLVRRDRTENFRELAPGRRWELWLVPLGEPSELSELADAMKHVAPVPPVAYLAARIVPI